MEIKFVNSSGVKKIQIPKTAVIHWIHGSMCYIIVDYYKNIDVYKKLKNVGQIYKVKSLVWFVFEASNIYQCGYKCQPPNIDNIYMRIYQINHDIFEIASEKFGVKLTPKSELTNEQREFIEEGMTTTIKYVHIKRFERDMLVVNEVYVKSRSNAPRFAIETKKASIKNVFQGQADVYGISDDQMQLYSDFCNKEEYDEALCSNLQIFGIKSFTI